MSHILTKTAKSALFGVLLTTGIWTAAVYHQSSKVDRRKIATSDAVSKAFRDSPAHRLVNPKQVRHTSDSRTITLHVSSKEVVDRPRVLAWMLNGFFQSWIFAPEALAFRVFFNTTGRVMTHLSGLPEHLPPPIWYSTQLSDSSLPPRNSLLFGTFQVADIWTAETDGEEECGVDIAFGSDKGTFAGYHRLSVATLKEDGESYLRLTFACMTCNPAGDKSWVETFGFMLVFHKIYAEILFRAAAGNVVRNLESRGARVLLVSSNE
ncbi:hypothetical protein M409DRAFT_19181 [Zasmidium cellare ATCC 36951]|uniref:DUF1990 domain-containing protein n=1 Tax=Zasmidium cellare ATCC 36951 TaxID=1080233 RepID=A0A6A6CTE2_ZASCE|nr:uncharacterized protein M409DRAFT_19181 [Zasmidium cellare ATCC 36951]KAF2170361.1 hypothetical protein M409DRAFT_19181 [Zasmidium cellare ATCC 36951]